MLPTTHDLPVLDYLDPIDRKSAAEMEYDRPSSHTHVEPSVPGIPHTHDGRIPGTTLSQGETA
jgi:hypothetical protein